MRRLIVISLLVAAATGGVYCYLNYDFEIRRGEDGLESITIRPKGDRAASGEASDQASDDESPRPLIRIATFNLGLLDEKKLGDPRVSAVLANVIPRFDVMAVQEIRGGNQGVLLRLVERINAGGRNYDFAACPTAIPDAAGEYRAFLFDRATIEIDRSTVQSVGDPGGQLQHRPLVALFRAKGPDPSDAFTFKLINVQTDPDRTQTELELLDDVYKAVRDDRLHEDDVILLGDLGGTDGPDRLGRMLEVASAITDTPTTIRGTRPVDNIMFDPRATAEFTGRAGVLDLMRELHLTWQEVSEVSDHLPVWAEFDPREGDRSADVAGRAGRATR